MNSDPYESAAWRAFGMMDADEAAGFDEAMRDDPALRDASRGIDRLAAAVAVASAVPVAPRAGQLDRLHRRLGLQVSRGTNWFAISGWAAAAILMVVLILDRHSNNTKGSTLQAGANEPSKSDSPKHGSVKANDLTEPRDEVRGTDASNTAKNETPAVAAEGDGKVVVAVETKRLIQEIGVLRDKLATLQERDRNRFEPVAGMAWPVVMRMRPPGSGSSESLALNTGAPTPEEPTLTTMLGDGLIGSINAFVREGTSHPFEAAAVSTPDPSAIPIYDAARDSGTLVVSHLPELAAGESYNLWVQTKSSGNPVYVGRLPDSDVQGADSFEFSLGATGTIPTGFILTKDSQSGTTPPSDQNTFLQGPK